MQTSSLLFKGSLIIYGAGEGLGIDQENTAGT